MNRKFPGVIIALVSAIAFSSAYFYKKAVEVVAISEKQYFCVNQKCNFSTQLTNKQDVKISGYLKVEAYSEVNRTLSATSKSLVEAKRVEFTLNPGETKIVRGSFNSVVLPNYWRFIVRVKDA